MISRVFNEREKSEVIAAIEAFEEALRQLDRMRKTAPDAATRARAELQHERISQLLELARLGQAAHRRARLDGEGRRRAARAVLAGAALLTASGSQRGPIRCRPRSRAAATTSRSIRARSSLRSTSRAWAGAYIASAEGRRVPRSTPRRRRCAMPYSTSWFDYDLSLGISSPGAFATSDFDNHGDDAKPPAAARKHGATSRTSTSAEPSSSAGSGSRRSATCSSSR